MVKCHLSTITLSDPTLGLQTFMYATVNYCYKIKIIITSHQTFFQQEQKSIDDLIKRKRQIFQTNLNRYGREEEKRLLDTRQGSKKQIRQFNPCRY